MSIESNSKFSLKPIPKGIKTGIAIGIVAAGLAGVVSLRDSTDENDASKSLAELEREYIEIKTLQHRFCSGSSSEYRAHYILKQKTDRSGFFPNELHDSEAFLKEFNTLNAEIEAKNLKVSEYVITPKSKISIIYRLGKVEEAIANRIIEVSSGKIIAKKQEDMEWSNKVGENSCSRSRPYDLINPWVFYSGYRLYNIETEKYIF